MVRYRFQDDANDEDETDFDDSPSKDQWEEDCRNHYHQRSCRQLVENDSNAEDGEIITGDESSSSCHNSYSDRMDLDDMSDYPNDSGVSHYNQCHQPNYCWSQQQEEESEQETRRHSRRSLRSYFPSFSRETTRHNDQIPSPDGEGSRDWEDIDRVQSSSHEEDHLPDGTNQDQEEEYRLVASSKYDRNYNRSDFYPNGHHSNDRYEKYTNKYNSDGNVDENHSYMNPVSDDEDGAPRHLVRSNPSQRTASEVHYHIYVSEKQAARWFPSNEIPPPGISETNWEETEPRRKIAFWKRVTLWAVLTQLLLFLVHRYDAIDVPPPPTYLTWEEYRSHQFRLVRRFSREGKSLLHHLARATTRRLVSTVEEEEKNGSTAPRYTFPRTWESFSSKNGNATHQSVGFQSYPTHPVIFGQEAALEHLRQGLNRWVSQERNQFEPLVVYVFGGRGIGKGSLPYLLLEQLEPYESSTSSNLHSSSEACDAEGNGVENYCPLLYLTASGYRENFRSFCHTDNNDHRVYREEAFGEGLVEGGGEFSSSHLYQIILDHVVAAGGGGSIVALDRMDTFADCEPGIEDCSFDLPKSWLPDLMAEVRSQPTLFGNTVFVLTAEIGSTTVEKWTRKRLQLSLSEAETTAAGHAEVEALLRYELQRHYAASVAAKKTNDNVGSDALNQSMGIDQWLLVPMVPLEKSSMASILENLASSNGIGRQTVLLTKAASDRILDSLEWHQWIHKTSGEILRTWSPEGASPLFRLWEERVVGRTLERSECPSVHVGESHTTIAPNLRLVLDFEGRATDRMRLRSCELIEGNEEDSVTSTDGRQWKCHSYISSCTFYI